MKLTHASLFSGIGACDLAAEWMGWQNVFHCEWNHFCQKILAHHFPNSIPYSDVTKTDFSIHRGKINVLTGGFPCQGFSIAGLRAGTEDDRYLWPEYLRAIDECNPDWIVGENVTGILTMEDKSGIYRDVFAKVENRKITRFHDIDYYEAVYTRQAKMLVNSICESLEERGYQVQTFAIPAASVEAPHKRERIWFVANRVSGGWIGRGRGQKLNGVQNKQEVWTDILSKTERRSSLGAAAHSNCNDAGRSGYGQTGQTQRTGKVIRQERKRIRTVIERIGSEENITDTDKLNGKLPRFRTSQISQQQKGSIFKSNDTNSRSPRWKELNVPDFAAKSGFSGRRNNERQRTRFDNFPTQSPVCSGNDGVSTRLDGVTFPKWRNESIKAAGNSLVPHIPFEIFTAIEKIYYI